MNDEEWESFKMFVSNMECEAILDLHERLKDIESQKIKSIGGI